MTSLRSTEIWAAVAIAAAAFVSAGEADAPAGFGIGPGMILIENIKPGAEAVNIGAAPGGISFDISNGTAKAQVFNVTALKPRDAIGKWEMGYEEIPDASWLRLEMTEIEVPAKSEKKISLSVQVPDKPEYYNRKWMAIVVCAPGKKDPRGVVGLRVASRVQIETLPRSDVDGANAGKTALIPIATSLSDALPGLKIPLKFKVRNNDDKDRTFNVKHIEDLEADSTKHPRYFGTGFTPVIKPGWVTVEGTSFTVKAGETKEVSLSVAIPKDAERGKKYEELVFLQDDKGTIDFVRVRVEMAKPK